VLITWLLPEAVEQVAAEVAVVEQVASALALRYL
jgi:hypothetical protein